jgi:hypothetical protein
MAPPVSRTRVGFGALLFYYLFSGAFLWFGRFAWKEGASVIGGILFIVGLIFLVATVYHTLELFKYGDLHLEIETRPFPGGKLVALIRAPSGIGGARTLNATLQCKYVYWRSNVDGRGRSISEDVVWSTEKEFPVTARLGRSQCRIEFDVPADAQSSTTSTTMGGGQSPGHYWEVRVHADVPGIDLMRTFLITVGVRPPSKMAA